MIGLFKMSLLFIFSDSYFFLSQTKKLISKVAVRDTVHYRKLTDKPEGEEDDQNLLPISATELALGMKYFNLLFFQRTNNII